MCDQTIAAAAGWNLQDREPHPGHYQLTARKEGFANSSVTAVELAPVRLLISLSRLAPKPRQAGF